MEGVDHAIRNNIKHIHLSRKNNDSKLCKDLSFDFIESLKDIKSFWVHVKISSKIKIDSIYGLANLEDLLWPNFNKNVLDLSKFKNLKCLVIGDHQNILNYDSLTGLQRLYIASIRGTDLSLLRNIKSLKKLELRSPKIHSLSGIEHLPSLKSLRVYRAPNLIDISCINENLSINTLILESINSSCDYLSLSSNSSIKEARFLTKTDSIEFISSMERIESAFFLDVISNDLSPLFRANNLKHVGFSKYKNKYNFTQKEIYDHFKKVREQETG